MAAKKSKKSSRKKTTKVKKTAPKRKAKPRGKAKAAKVSKPKRVRRKVRGRAEPAALVAYESRGIGARSGGQSGDTQGLSAGPTANSESVEELLEEGQSFEAEVLNGVENAADPDESEVRTREVPEDDVAEEYRENQD